MDFTLHTFLISRSLSRAVERSRRLPEKMKFSCVHRSAIARLAPYR